MNCWSSEGAEDASDCWLRTIDFALKLVSVKFAAFAFVLPTLSLVFWKSAFFSLFFLALYPILAALSSTVEQIHATKVKPPSEKIPPRFPTLCGVVILSILSITPRERTTTWLMEMIQFSKMLSQYSDCTYIHSHIHTRLHHALAYPRQCLPCSPSGGSYRL